MVRQTQPVPWAVQVSCTAQAPPQVAGGPWHWPVAVLHVQPGTLPKGHPSVVQSPSHVVGPPQDSALLSFFGQRPGSQSGTP